VVELRGTRLPEGEVTALEQRFTAVGCNGGAEIDLEEEDDDDDELLSSHNTKREKGIKIQTVKA
jgi:hypothetical protein